MSKATKATTIALWLVGVVAVGLAIGSLLTAGIGYDAVFEAEASHITRAIDSSLTLAQAYEVAPITTEFYGMLPYQVADAVHALLTGADAWMPAQEPGTYVWLGAVNLAFAVLASAVLAWAVAVSLRSRLAGAFAWAVTLVTPLWLGMSTINYKDMPVASGLTMISAGLVLGWCRWRRWPVVGIGALLAAVGGTWALGTRAGSLALVVALAAVSLMVFALAQIRMRHPRRLIGPGIIAAAATVPAVAVTWLTNPIARIDAPTWLSDSLAISREYIWVGEIRTNGQDLPSTDLPWWYAPIWLLAQLPLLSTAAILMGLVFLAASLVSRDAGLPRPRVLAASPLLTQGLVLPLAIVASGAVLYDGIRHLLFMVPGLATVAAIGIASLERAAVRPAATRLGLLAPGAALLVVMFGIVADIRWYPYPYAFVNPIAGWDKSERNWELDYWGLTSREGVERLRSEGFDPIVVKPAAETGRPWGGITEDEAAALAPPQSGQYVFLRWDARIQEEWCARTFTIERDGLVLGEGGYCPK